jgi:hypothetical protein
LCCKPLAAILSPVRGTQQQEKRMKTRTVVVTCNGVDETVIPLTGEISLDEIQQTYACEGYSLRIIGANRKPLAIGVRFDGGRWWTTHRPPRQARPSGISSEVLNLRAGRLERV